MEKKADRKFSTTNTIEAAYLIYCGVKPTKQTRKTGQRVRMYFDIPRSSGRNLIRANIYSTSTTQVNARAFARALYAVHGYNQIPMRRDCS